MAYGQRTLPPCSSTVRLVVDGRRCCSMARPLGPAWSRLARTGSVVAQPDAWSNPVDGRGGFVVSPLRSGLYWVSIGRCVTPHELTGASSDRRGHPLDLEITISDGYPAGGSRRILPHLETKDCPTIRRLDCRIRAVIGDVCDGLRCRPVLVRCRHPLAGCLAADLIAALHAWYAGSLGPFGRGDRPVPARRSAQVEPHPRAPPAPPNAMSIRHLSWESFMEAQARALGRIQPTTVQDRVDCPWSRTCM